MLEVHLDIITSNIRGHSNDRCAIELPDDVAGRNSVEVWHDDVHQDHIVLHTFVHLIDCFQTIKLYQISQVSCLSSMLNIPQCQLCNRTSTRTCHQFVDR